MHEHVLTKLINLGDTVLFDLSNDFFLVLLLQLDDLLELLQVVTPLFLIGCELLQILLLFLQFGHFVTQLLDLRLILSLQIRHFLFYSQDDASNKKLVTKFVS